MRAFIFSLISFVCFSGCQKLERQNGDFTDHHTATVSFDVVSDRQQLITRNGYENRVVDMNIFLFGNDLQTCIQAYFKETMASITLPFDEYTLYVIANHGEDIGPKSLSELLELQVTGTDDSLAMSAVTTINVIPDNGPSQILPAIKVSRCMAKIDYNIAIAASAPDLRLHSARFINIPKCSAAFPGSQSAPLNPDGFCNSRIIDLSAEGSTHSGQIYIHENLQGIVPGITEQKDKTYDNAPALATFMLIRVKDKANVLYDFVIYLGENTTDNFNLRRNTSTTLNIQIEGVNRMDWRIHNYSVELEDGNSFYHNTQYYDIHKQIMVSTESSLYDFTVDVRIDSADNSKVWINDTHANKITLKVKPNEIFDLRVYTSFDLITRENETVRYEITIRDNFGYETVLPGTALLHNFITLRPLIIDAAVGAGIREITGAYSTLMDADSRGYPHWHIRASSNENEITASVVITPGWRLDGWYLSIPEEGSHLISDFTTLVTKPTLRVMNIQYRAYRY